MGRHNVIYTALAIASDCMKNTHLATIALAVVVVVVISAYLVLGSSAQTVVAGDNVSVYYTGTFANGTVFNSNVGSQPFIFTAGANQVIPGFDQAVIGMRLNQTKTVTIPANDAYGPVNASLFVAIPANQFANQTIYVGNSIIESSSTGQQYTGIVTSVTANVVTVDFNPALAGKTLVFTIHVVGIRKG
jgi:peptidylprolyl isomerase